jgi:hypothetical protein
MHSWTHAFNSYLELLKFPIIKRALSPKIPCGFWTNLGSFGHSWRNHFCLKSNLRNEVSNLRILKLLYWTSTSKNQKISVPHTKRFTRLLQSKLSFFLGPILTMKFFTTKFMKIRYYLGIFITFGGDFQWLYTA